MSNPSRKQQLYADLMMRGFSDLRVLLTPGTNLQPHVHELVDAMLDLLHNLPKAMLCSEGSMQDIFFLNYQARNFCRFAAAKSLMYYSWYLATIQELFAMVPEQLRCELKWSGPEVKRTGEMPTPQHS